MDEVAREEERLRDIDIIARDLGKVKALEIIALAGGTRVWIGSESIGETHFLFELDKDTKAYLVSTFGSSEIVIPRQLFTPKHRSERIRNCLLAGMKHNDIAVSVGCSVRTVGEVAKAMRDEGLLKPVNRRDVAEAADDLDDGGTRRRCAKGPPQTGTAKRIAPAVQVMRRDMAAMKKSL